MSDSKIGLLGAGGQAREIASFFGPEKVAFSAVDQRYLNSRVGGLVDIDTEVPSLMEIPVIGAVGEPRLRRSLVSRWKGDQYANVIAGTFISTSDVKLGSGVLIAPGSVVTVGSELGDHTHINIGATISHDCSIGIF